MEKKSRKSASKWTQASERSLIAIWSDKLDELRGCRKNKHILVEMVAELRKRGLPYTLEELKTKMHNLSSRYRREKQAVGTTDGSPSEWDLFSEMETLLEPFESDHCENLVQDSIRLPYAKKSWQNLRDCRRDAIKRRHSGTSAKTWKYQDAMTNLEPFIVNRDSLPNTRQSSTFEEDSESNDFLENEPKMKKISNDEEDTQRKEKQTVINNGMPEQRNSRPSNPALYNFFITMYETALTFPPNLQTEVKRKLFNILSDYEEKAAGRPDEIFGI